MQFDYIHKEPGPQMLLEAIKLLGITEKAGKLDNPTILGWAKECDIKGYTHDSIPWCGLTMAVCAHRAGWPLPIRPLWAQDWLKWGTRQDIAKLGDVLVFHRNGGGHVAMYIGEDPHVYYILGGNQMDKVCIEPKAKSQLLGIRRAPWRIAQPYNVRSIKLPLIGHEE